MYDVLETTTERSTTTAQRDPVLSTLLSQLPVGVVIASRDGSLELVSEVARALFAEHRRTNTPEPWVGPAGESGDVLDPIRWVIARVLLTGEVIRNEEIEFIDRRDEWRTLSVSGTPLENPRGEIVNALVTFVDVTALNRAKEWEPLIRAISKL